MGWEIITEAVDEGHFPSCEKHFPNDLDYADVTIRTCAPREEVVRILLKGG